MDKALSGEPSCTRTGFVPMQVYCYGMTLLPTETVLEKQSFSRVILRKKGNKYCQPASTGYKTFLNSSEMVFKIKN